MFYSGKKNKRKRYLSFSFIFLMISFTQITTAQNQNKLIKELPDNIDSTKNSFTEVFRKNNISIQVNGAVLPKANFNTREGNYYLYSRLHSSFSAGFNYIINLDEAWSLYSGLHFNLTKSNYFGNIPPGDLAGSGVRISEDSPPLIYDKEVFTRLFVPLIVKRRFRFSESGFWDIQAGINLNYSGFSSDIEIGMSVGDTSNRQIQIFNSNFKSNNNLKPWVSFSLGAAKNFLLKNKNLISVGLFCELSNTDFLKADYEITIPNKPVTTGTYSVTGSCLGLAVEYTFTGVNKRLVRSYQHKKPF
ncbi:hypothetical protein [Terrimonas pollutisoli]|uniref:hypothetical protein n=1 Tax=Terrimonas pollutisoli TaxID=3034147 RepID=UPI0023ED0869|nr:hypothetical protein [Terrimonas sp. H1YJ31]